MKNPRFLKGTIAVAASALLASLVATSTLSLFVKDASHNGAYGEIGLRSYFHRGSGSQNDPYVITSARHLYNLSRLQSLGVFPAKEDVIVDGVPTPDYWYFQVGLVDLDGVDSAGVPMCYDSEGNRKPYLDMTDSGVTIYSIGSEAVPFYGHFDGQNVEIKGLDVYANPEDAGLFGYTAHGSLVQNLFLDGTTIHTLGYASSDAALYGPDSTLQNNVGFNYYENGDPSGSPEVFNVDNSTEVYYNFTGLDFSGDTPDDPATLPLFTMTAPESGPYQHRALLSGVLLRQTEDGIEPDYGEIFDFFKAQKEAADDPQPYAGQPEYPLEATSSASIVASYIDTSGLSHSRVLITLDFRFRLEDTASTSLSMEVSLKTDHGNNIGLAIGHCDGSVQNVYAHNGAFDMNAGHTIDPEAGYQPLSNGSNLGLIGRIGNTVFNGAADDMGSSTSDNKDIGVLDFSDIYSAINPTGFTQQDSSGYEYWTYTPGSANSYLRYLRYDTSGAYVTHEEDSISFVGQTIIENSDFGVFTVATDHNGNGTGSMALQFIQNSLVRKDDSNTSTLYYATGEYDATNPALRGKTFRDYRDSFVLDAPRESLLGHYLPSPYEVTSESFRTRELRHNYYFRFTLSPSQRRLSGNSLYFSDLDRATQGGSFLSKYFHYKLVDGENQQFNYGSPRSGVYLRNTRGKEISSFSASLATSDRSHAYSTRASDMESWARLFCLQKDEEFYAENMINFEISTAYANVTVVAAAASHDVPCAVGVYAIDDDHIVPTGNFYSVEPGYMDFENPDYAFMIPDEDHFAFFDYDYDTVNKVGRIGFRENASTFSVASTASPREAFLPSEETPFGYDSSAQRLFVHTFKLPQGRYCIGSATGANATLQAGSTQTGLAKIYYVCAQGQTEGEQSFSGNVHAGNDVVEDVDFLKVSRFDASGNAQINLSTDTRVDEHGDPIPYDKTVAGSLEMNRCYVSFNPDSRSTFSATPISLSFAYADGNFNITSSAIAPLEHLALRNYGTYYKDTHAELSGTAIANLNLRILDSSSTLIKEGTDDEVSYNYVTP